VHWYRNVGEENDTVNVFIGLALTFGTISLIVSAVVEGIASTLNWRSHTLLTGLQELLNDKALTGLALEVLNHAAANPPVRGMPMAHHCLRGKACCGDCLTLAIRRQHPLPPERLLT
jgi:hypothetical protein